MEPFKRRVLKGNEVPENLASIFGICISICVHALRFSIGTKIVGKSVPINDS
jgi:hypothetical protein